MILTILSFAPLILVTLFIVFAGILVIADARRDPVKRKAKKSKTEKAKQAHAMAYPKAK